MVGIAKVSNGSGAVKSHPGRPLLQGEIRELISTYGKGESHLGLCGRSSISSWAFLCPLEPAKYWIWGRDDGRGKGTPSQRGATFVRNHADAIVACDFMVAVTAKFQLLYVFVILEFGSRILQCNVTTQPAAEWTLQQFREGLSGRTLLVFVIHDRNCIFSRSPNLNAHEERFVRTIKESYLERMISFGESAVRKRLLNSWCMTIASATTKFWTNTLNCPEPEHAGGEGEVQRRERLGGLPNFSYTTEVSQSLSRCQLSPTLLPHF